MSQSNNHQVAAVVLAAGQGKRMKSALPKVLHDLLGVSILSRILNSLDMLGLAHIHIVIGHQAEAVRQHLLNHPPTTPWSTCTQEPQLGTGHALMQVVPSLGSFEGTLLTTTADTPLLRTSTLQALINQHQGESAMITLLTTEVEDPRSYGRILRDEAGQITGIVEDKDASDEQRTIHEVNPAIYCHRWPEISTGLTSLETNNQQREYYLTDLVSWAHQAGHRISSAPVADWREVAGVNSREELAQAAAMLRDRVLSDLMLVSGATIQDPHTTWIAPEVKVGCDTTILPGCFLIGEIEIGPNCTIGPHTTIQGPARIGANSSVVTSVVSGSDVGEGCRIGPFSHLRNEAHISDRVRIGNYVEVKQSSVQSNSNVSHLSYIGDADIGAGVNIGAGTITANYDHLSKQKAKTVVGDGASTGSNSVLVAPVEVGQNASVAAGTVVTKNVPDGALAVGRARQENKIGWTQGRLKKLHTPKL